MSLEDHCDGSCSNMYPTPRVKLLSHEEVEEMLDKAIDDSSSYLEPKSNIRERISIYLKKVINYF